MAYDRYTRPLTAKHLRNRDVTISTEAYTQRTSTCSPGVKRPPVPATTLVPQLEAHIAETEKKWTWIAASFDTVLLANDTPREVELAAAPSVTARLPMPRPLSPFSLSSVFLHVNTPDSSATTDHDEDTSAGDLSLYRWLSAQGAQTILPGRSPVFTPPPHAKRVSALNHLSFAKAPPTPSRGKACTLPLSPPASSRLPFSAQFDTPEQPLPLQLRVPPTLNPRVEIAEKPASSYPRLPVSPPATPVTAHFCEAPKEAVDPFSDAAEAEADLELPSFDLDRALSRNLSLQHASATAVRSYRLVMQELKGGANHWTTVARMPSTRPHPSADIATTPAIIAKSSCQLACSHSEGTVDAVQDSSTNEFAALLMRQAAEEEVQAEQLRALAARLQDISTQRRRLAASVLAGLQQHAG